VLRAISFLPIEWEAMWGYRQFIDRVNEQAKGELTINYLGAQEVIPLYDMADALRTGAIDLTVVFCTMFKERVPEAGALEISEVSVSEERKNGFYDLLLGRMKEGMNIYYLTRAMTVVGSFMFLNEKVEKPEDLSGMKFATGIGWFPLFAHFGAIGIRMPMGDKYTAVERGLVDGITGTLHDHVGYSLYEVTKYMVDQKQGAPSTAILMNLDRFNSLPKHLQDVLTGAAVELEPDLEAYFLDLEVTLKDRLKAEGMEIITFSAEDAARFNDIFMETNWKELEKKVSPESYTKLRELLSK